jgi:hypothetical protein
LFYFLKHLMVFIAFCVDSKIRIRDRLIFLHAYMLFENVLSTSLYAINGPIKSETFITQYIPYFVYDKNKIYIKIIALTPGKTAMPRMLML